MLMPVYSFYPQRADGGIKASIAMELEDDEAARAKAHELIGTNYQTAQEIAVWRDDDLVVIVRHT